MSSSESLSASSSASLSRLILTVFLTAPAGAADDGVDFFERQIRPVLAERCYECHSAGAKKVRAGLYLDTRAGMRQERKRGPAVVPGDVRASRLVAAIRHEGRKKMPPGGKLPDEVVADFVRWVEMGAPDPRGGPAAGGGSGRPWSFEPVRPSPPPAVRGEGWARTPVDLFVLARLEEAGLSPAPEASRRQLIRRLSFDLTGLPPSPEEVDAFLRDESLDAYERLVDRFLASPHHGERWGRHWLDVVRYAETEGFEYDRRLPDAWRYRDYVIRSFNEDRPYDRFVSEQLAGDEIDPEDLELRVASGFHRLGPVRRNAGNQEVSSSRNEVLTERTDIIGVAFLGLTVGCARCHDHKFDPISQKDYYRLQAFLAATREDDVVLATAEEQAARKQRAGEVEKEISRIKKALETATGDAETRLRGELAAARKLLPAPLPAISSIRNDPQPTAIHVLQRGSWEEKGEPVGMRAPGALLESDVPEVPLGAANPRTRLARWITDPSHPLTARVLVNRLWQYHFGGGIVPTANDFGANGSSPSHPELLDYLAAELVARGWRLKPLHRLVVLSSAYRQSHRSPEAARGLASDPGNRLLWAFARRRLDAEEIRDALLVVSGRLNSKAGGRSVVVPVERDLVDLLYDPAQWNVSPDPAEHFRRSVYLIAKRNLRLPFLEVFDQPAFQTSCSRRESSTHAPQALEMLNSRLSGELAAAFADRLRKEAGRDVNQQVERAFLLACGRPPTELERELAVEFLEGGSLRELALALFNLNAFIYVD
ncbi:MAG: PSD1 and planctomycete cytochrome C domain-containing protein [Planctomycetota bacterium]|nr:PSD1 and planctomycete cytochrome C domain-containing protein [Planctomycetota bacterium]